MIEIKSLKDAEEVLREHPRVVMYFWRKKCPGCPAVKEHLEKIEKLAPSWKLCSFSVEDLRPALAWHVMATPTVLLFVNGRVERQWYTWHGNILRVLNEIDGAG